MARYILCPYCKKRIDYVAMRSHIARDGHIEMPCPGCKRTLGFRLRPKEEKNPVNGNTSEVQPKRETIARLYVVENVFAYAADFPLYEGLNRVGRYNDKHSALEVPIRTNDPSMDRTHCLIEVSHTAEGLEVVVMDNDSMTGTFVSARELAPGERYVLQDGDVLTLGATSLIYSCISSD